MGEIVNLRRERKRRARAEASQAAASNRARHGATSAERAALRLEAERSDAVLDGARLRDADPRTGKTEAPE